MKIKPTIGNMSRLALFAWATVAGVLFAGCQREDLARQEEASSPDEGFMLSFRAAPPTRSSIALTEGEDQVNSLYLLFFEESNNGSGQFLGYYEVPTHDADGNLLDPPLSSKEQVRVKFSDVTVIKDPFDNTQTFVPDGDYSLLLLANVEEFLDGEDIDAWISGLQGKTESGVLNGKFLQVSGTTDETDNSHAIQPTNLPMNARVKRAAHQGAVSVELRRSVFRVSVENNAAAYELKSASLWNVYPETPAWENVMNLFELPRVKRFYGVAATNDAIGSGLYAFENLALDNAQNDEQTTCLILGFLKDGVTYYYRANINLVAGLGQQLTRNGAYRLRINSISGPGESCELDAYTSEKLLLDVTVNEWDVDNQGNILSDGDNLLAVPTTSIVFTPLAETRSYSIYTQGTATLELSKSILPVGLTADLTGNTLTVAATATSEVRDGYIEVRYGTLKVIINIHQAADSDKYIELSRYSAPTFPGNGVYQMEGSVRVTSSGIWSAKIYGAGFTFQYRGPDPNISPAEIFHRESGQGFTITTLGTNANTEPRYAFVVVYLDEDPEVNQVFIVAQAGKADFDFAPPISATEQIAFDATGTRVIGRDKYFVQVGDGLEWQAAVSNPHFQLRYYDETGTELPGSTTSVIGPGYFAVASDMNTTTLPITAYVAVSLTTLPNNTQNITLSQDPFTLTLGAVPDVPSGGATREIPMTLTPAWSEATWTATVVTSTESHKAYFDTPGTFSATGNLGSPLTLTFAKLPIIYTQFSPQATVTVTIDGTEVSRTVLVRQTSAPPRPLIFQSNARTGYGSLAPNPSHAAYFDAFNYVLRDGVSFAPTGVVRTAGGFLFTVGNVPAVSATIFNANVESINATARGYVKSWMNGNPANFLMMVNDNVNSASDREALLRLFSTAYSTASVSEGLRTIYARPASGVAAQKVWDYIMVNGPFGPVSTSLTFRTDGYIRALTSWPSTTVPLLYGSGYPQVAIDPVLRILYIGDVDLFGTVGSRNFFPAGSDKLKFMDNLIAFMVNAAQYGDYFLSEFR